MINNMMRMHVITKKSVKKTSFWSKLSKIQVHFFENVFFLFKYSKHCWKDVENFFIVVKTFQIIEFDMNV